MVPNFLEDWHSLLCITIMLIILTAPSQLKPAIAGVKQETKERSKRRRLTQKRGKTAWLLWTDISYESDNLTHQVVYFHHI